MCVILIAHGPPDGMAQLLLLLLQESLSRSRVASAAPAAPSVSTTRCTPAWKVNQLLSGILNIDESITVPCMTEYSAASPRCSAIAMYLLQKKLCIDRLQINTLAKFHRKDVSLGVGARSAHLQEDRQVWHEPPQHPLCLAACLRPLLLPGVLC